MAPDIKAPRTQSLGEATNENDHSGQEGECFGQVPPSSNLLTRTSPSQLDYTLKDRKHREVASKEKMPPRKVLILLPPPPVSNKVNAAPIAEKRFSPQYTPWAMGLQ
ncbi:hypothetical protein N7541_008270 [Penicillium brevicompactum]|uniref:Uncharacterized protein n=1 Tax=Penicillium brevicompactum TaxID=5074 RepID=A0A9W9UMH4_PENBR|nr:hypothetical protein N7541_008270 [Penicillium brevicompactum]